jgi:two-component system sensor kinase
MLIVSFNVFVSASNLLEWSGITAFFDIFEDYVVILEPILWLFFFVMAFGEIIKKEIEQTKDNYKLIVESQNDIIVKTDAKGKILFASPNFSEIFHTNGSPYIGRSFFLYLGENNADNLAKFNAIQSPPYVSFLETRSFSRMENMPQWFAWSNKAILDSTGAISSVISVGRNITQRKISEEMTIKTLKDKETLLKEVHHRVKNNLLILYGLIELQQDSISNDNEHELLDIVKNRILAIGKVHQMLYESKNLSEILFSEYIRSMCSKIMNSYIAEKTEITMNFDLEPINIDISRAVPCALILNELLTNCIKHAFIDRSSGQIEIGLKKKDNKTQLIVKDNGIGMSGSFIEKTPASFGLTLVTMLTKQINAEMAYQNANGSLFIFTF